MSSESETEKQRPPFPLCHVSKVASRPDDEQWLIEGLWLLSGVGIVGGVPKSMKTWLASEIAVAVASGTKALGHFSTKEKGPVIFFGAEDEPPMLRNRFDGIASARNLRLEQMPLFLLDIPYLRLDQKEHIERLEMTIKEVGAKLIVLDPFVRLARVDENSAQEVSAVLGDLRELQRRHEVAVLLVHHMRKAPSAHPGQRLRGSGDFAAWSDSALYLTRKKDHTLVTIEHRSAPAPEPIQFKLDTKEAPHLVLLAPPAEPEEGTNPLESAIIQRLHGSGRPMTTVELRDHLKIRKATLVSALDNLRSRGNLLRQEDGWALERQPPSVP